MDKRQVLLALGLLCCSLMMPRDSLAADPPEYRVGLARACITPEESLWMAGYGSRRKPSDGVLDDLYAQAMMIEDADGWRALLISVDLCALRTPTVNEICKKIGQRTGLERSQILINLSHTHSGPAVDLMNADFYPIPPEGRKKLEAYSERVKTHLVDLAEKSLKDLQPAKLAFGKGTATFFDNRRRLNPEGRYVGMGPNPQNHADRDVPVLRVTTPAGDVRALVSGAACHNVTLGGGSYKISADYAGWARIYIENQLPDVQAMFVTGCGADANPTPRSTADQEEWTRRHGESLGKEVLEVISGPIQPVTGPIATAFDFVDLSLQKVTTREKLEEKRRGSTAYQAGKMLEVLDRGETLPTTFAAPISVWQFGDCLTLVGLPEEIVSEYVSLLQRTLGSEGLWVAGYCNDVSGYLPTVKILNEGGYECRGLFGPNLGWFAPEAEEQVVEAVSRLAKQVGREPPSPSQPDTDPVGWWRFEPGDLLRDASGHGHTLVANHGVEANGEPAPAGDSQASASFTGESYLEGDKLALANASTFGLTAAAWIKPDEAALTGTRMIVCQWANEVHDDKFGLYLEDGKPGFAVADGSTNERGLVGNTALEAGQWYFVVGTWDALDGRYRIYVNGRAEPSVGYQTGDGINTSSQTTLQIGAQAVSEHERNFHGMIDEVMLFEAVLEKKAVQRMHGGKLGHSPRQDPRRSEKVVTTAGS